MSSSIWFTFFCLSLYTWNTAIFNMYKNTETCFISGQFFKVWMILCPIKFAIGVCVCWPFFMPPPFIMGGGHIASPLSVRLYIRTYVPSRMYEKWFPGDIFWIQRCIGFIFHTQVYNYNIQVKFDYGQNPLIIIRVMALDLGTKNGFRAISFEYIGEFGFIFNTKVYNHKIQVKFDYG